MWSATLLLVVIGAAVAEIPTAPCNIKAEDFDECLKNSFNDQLPRFAKGGIKELKFPPLDPLYVPQLLITYNSSEVQAKSSVRNSFTHGLRHTRILAIRSDLSNPQAHVIEADFVVPRIVVEGTYKAEGAVGAFPINSKGVYNISMTNVSATARVEGHVVTLNGKDHLKVHQVLVTPEIGDMVVYASNLVNGNKELSALALQMVNQFWRILYQEMLPYAQQGFDEVLRGVMNKYTLQVPYDQMWQVE